MKSPWLVALLFCVALHVSAQSNDSLIAVLKKEIAQKEVYVQHKLNAIATLRQSLAHVNRLTLPEQFELYNALYHQYKVFINDSAFKYATRLIETAGKLKDKSRLGYARVKLSFILNSSGMFKETFDSLNVVEPRYLDDTTKANYYWLVGKAYSDLNIYNKGNLYDAYYTNLSQHYFDSALQWCPPKSYLHYYVTAVKNGQVHHYQKVIDTIDELFRTQTLTTPRRAVNYYDLAAAYRGMHEEEKNLRCLLMSALCDVRAATKETAATYTLARLLYDRGDVANAYVFIRQALDDAEFYGSRQRMVEIGSILPMVASAALNQSESQRRLWLGYGVGLSVLFAVLGLFAYVSLRQLRKLKAAELTIKEANNTLQETNRQLTEANKIKEEYIGYSFTVNSEYLEKMESLKRSVDQKLTHKKYDDIKFIVNNINARRDREELYHSFDKVFLKLFPDFVKTFNSYFHKEDQFVTKEGQVLNTELRIFALIRMGITDTEDIARIMDYSVNTIYAYKTKVRNKSILPNEEFDRKIMEIQPIA